MDYYKKYERVNAVPEYFKEHIADVIARCNHELGKITDGAAFVFITDIHLHENPMTGIPLIREIAENTPVNKLFCGGDFPWAFGTKEECITDGYVSMELLAKLKDVMKLYIVRGNHEFTIREAGNSDKGYTMPYEQTCKMIMPYQSDGICAPDHAMYFYVDDTAEKIRYIIVDTCVKRDVPEETYWGTKNGFDTEQREWLTETALRLPDEDGWSVLVFGHVPCVMSLPSPSKALSELAEILKDFKNKRNGRFQDFSAVKAEFIAYICGHNHHDCHSVEDHTLFISTGSSARLYDDCWDRAEGTTDEELFDIYLIDKKNRTIKTLRVGAGVDREFAY